MSDFPKTLYRYRSLAGDHGRSGFEDAIVRSQMYWQTHKAFNDPFDCSPVLDFSMSRLKWKSYQQSVVSRNLSRADGRRRVAKLNLERSSMRKKQESLEQAFWHAIERTAFCCLSTDNVSVLMWSHYADYHRGVCFEFKESPQDLTFIALPISYSSTRPVVRPADEMNNETFTACVLSKSKDWEYEREFRMVDHGSGAGFRSFHPDRLKGLILGCRISKEDENYVLSTVRKHRNDIKVRKCVLDSSQYAIEIRDLHY